MTATGVIPAPCPGHRWGWKRYLVPNAATDLSIVPTAYEMRATRALLR